MERITSGVGILIIIVLAWTLSEKRAKVRWTTVIGALCLVMAIGALVFLLPQSAEFFLLANRVVLKLLSSAREGAIFLFGALALSPGETGSNGETSLGFFMAFQIFPAVIFFSALMSLLYHFHLIQPVIRLFAKLFRRFMHLSGAESLCASSNIFVGIESVFSIRPFLERLTRSELLTVMTAMMGTVASTTLAIYVSFLKGTLPTIAGHLISASVMAIPSAVLISKILIPETDEPVTMGHIPKDSEKRHSNFMGAVTQGALEGVKLAVGIGALLIAVLGLVALLNTGLHQLGVVLPGKPELSLQNLLGWVMIPFAWCLGIASHDLMGAAQLLGERLILTEVVAYRDLARFVAEGLIQEPRTVVVMSYALCGFTHVASVAIFVGGLSALIPSRRDEIAELGFRGLLAAFLATLMTGCIAGVFFTADKVFVLSL